MGLKWEVVRDGMRHAVNGDVLFLGRVEVQLLSVRLPDSSFYDTLQNVTKVVPGPSPPGHKLEMPRSSQAHEGSQMNRRQQQMTRHLWIND